MRALREMRRVLKPGGIIGVADADWDGMLLAPSTPVLLASIKLFVAFAEREGGSQRIGKQLRCLLADAGFKRVEAMARYSSFGNAQAVQAWGKLIVAMLQEEAIVATATTSSLVDRLTAMANEWSVWSEDPHAFMAQPGCVAVAWAD